MSKRAAATEVYLEEIGKVEQEIALLQHELEDAKKLNDELSKKIDRKDKDLIAKDEKLQSLKEKNAAELDLLQIELLAEKEKSSHELTFHESETKLLRINKQRMSDLLSENERLTAATTFLEEQIQKEAKEHALATHEMNKSMLELRHAMETKLRRELTGLDINFQREAFQALHERQKQAMFENAKLKDEVALQGVGIANLSARLAKQKILQNKCQKHLQFLNAKAQQLRDQLGEIATEKSALSKKKELYEMQMNNMRKEKERLMELLQQQAINQTSTQPASELYRSAMVNHSVQSLTLTGDVESLAQSTHRTAAAEESRQGIDAITDKLVHVACNFSQPEEEASFTLQSPTLSTRRTRGASILSRSIGNTTQNLMDLASCYRLLLERLHTIQIIHQVWQRRYRYLQSAILDLRPVTATEEEGQYKSHLFPLLDMVQRLRDHLDSLRAVEGEREEGSEERANGGGGGLPVVASQPPPLPPTHHKDQRGGQWDEHSAQSEQNLLSDLFSQLDGEIPRLTWEELQGDDSDLHQLLTPFHGTEANYISAISSIVSQEYVHRYRQLRGEALPEESDKDQNMLAWGLLKLFTAWHCPPDLPAVGGTEAQESLEPLPSSLSELSTSWVGNDSQEEEGEEEGEEARPPAPLALALDGASLERTLAGRIKVRDKQWLQRPPSHRDNVFALQMKDALLSSVAHKTARYTVQDNDRVLQTDDKLGGRRPIEIGEIGPPVVIRSKLASPVAPPVASMHSHSAQELVSHTASTLSAQGPGGESADPLLKRTRVKSMRTSGSSEGFNLQASHNMSRKLLLGLRAHNASRK